MEIINHNHISIRQKSRSRMAITFSRQKDGKDKVYFSKAIGDVLGIVKGRYIHIIGSLRDMYFICNDDSSGFYINVETRNTHTFYISSSALLRWFYKQTGYGRYPCSFYVTETNSYLNDNRLMKIELSSTIEQLSEETQTYNYGKNGLYTKTPNR